MLGESLPANGVSRRFYALLYMTQAFMEQKTAFGKVHFTLAHPLTGGSSEPEDEAAAAFAKSVHLENPNYTYVSVGLETALYDHRTDGGAKLYRALLNECGSPRGAGEAAEIRLVRDGRFVKKRVRYTSDDIAPAHVFRAAGAVLVTGGLGGLGYLTALHLAEHAGAKLALIGRSELNDDRKRKLRALEERGAEVAYYRADVSDAGQVNRLVGEVRSRFGGPIRGVVHSAGDYRNAFALRKKKAEAEAVLSAKVNGTTVLDEALKDEPLDYFVLYSSLAGVTGKVGQCDYAYGNAFMDAYAQQRERLRTQGARSGVSVSLNWPLWESGGMTLAQEEREELEEKAGLRALPADAGLSALRQGIRSGQPQLMAAWGIADKIEAFFTQEGAAASSALDSAESHDAATAASVDEARMIEETERFVSRIVAEETGVPEEQIDAAASFEQYGIDSIVINHFNGKMGKLFASLPKTLLFEYHNVRDVSRYLMVHHKKELLRLLFPDGAERPDNEAANRERADDGWEVLEPVIASTAIGYPALSLTPDPAPEPEVRSTSRSAEEAGRADEEEAIAIIGIHGRYPGADDLESFWQALSGGEDCVTEVPAERWNWRDYYDADSVRVKEGKSYCKWGGFLSGADRFDPLFFQISPREAEMMDPQERLFLETSYAALENAGYSKTKLQRLAGDGEGANVGVFAGVTSNTYMLLAPEQWARGNMVTPNSMPWSIANRVSYTMNLTGPSVPVDTACSSSLVAIHLACESLRKGECEMALAGGVNLYLHPFKYVGMSQIKMLSPTGRCHSFGADGDGFVPGEGVGAVLLKPLKRAVADGDRIHAVIRSSSVNHGGRTHGYSVPNPKSQESVIRSALDKAGLSASSIGYIEAHGTGTALGDPIEVAGLTSAFRKDTASVQYCAIGSVKTNIGHLESAAGIAGLTKIVLQMKHRKLAPSLHAERLNPNIEFETTPFYVQRELSEWKRLEEERLGRRVELPRRAGLSSFGAGGANAHIIIEEYNPPADQSADSASGPQCFVVSARSEESLRTAAARLAACAADKLRERGSAETPSFFGGTMEAVRAFAAQQYGADEGDIAKLSAAFEELEAYGHLRLIHALGRMGLFAGGVESYLASDLREMLGITPQYERLLGVLVDILARAGIVAREGDRIRLVGSLQEANPERLEQRRSAMVRRYPEITAYVRLLDACLDAYPEVLGGRRSFADVMFPEGSLSLVEGIYRGNGLVDYYNRVTARAAAASTALRLQRNPGSKVRIMEVGAGTGGTSAFVLEALKPYADRIAYCYTDISAGLLQQAKQTFGRDYPFAEFKTYNAELPPSAQGFVPHEFDIVVATNVLHATKRIEGTLGRLQGLLKPSGMIAINEMTSVVDFANLTFGLTGGWTVYEDQELRHFNSPLLSAENWRKALASSGFQETQAIGIEGNGPYAASQHVIMAEVRSDSARHNEWLAAAAYTLQEGREPMEERLACVSDDMERLLHMLTTFSDEGILLPGMFGGTAARQLVNRQAEGKDLSLEDAASLWVTGAAVDWDGVRHSRLRRLIDLPAYPFEQARYWIPIVAEGPGKEVAQSAEPAWEDERDERRMLDVVRKLEQGEISIEEADRMLEGIFNE